MCVFVACSTELQDYLNILMDQEFDTLIEDGSLEEVRIFICSIVCCIPYVNMCVYTNCFLLVSLITVVGYIFLFFFYMCRFHSSS